MKKVLPLCIMPYITSECWSFYKFSILQTNETHIDWLMDFMKVWTDEKGISFFGSPKERTQQSYYSDILEIKDGELLSCPAENITKYLIDKINSGYYILLDVNYCKLWDIDQNFTLHEVLIYGYDRENKCFYAPILYNGQFTQATIDFEELQAAYSDAVNYYKEDHNNIFWRRYWTYGIMLLRPKDYIPDTDHYFEFIREIRDEKNGCFYQKNEWNEALQEEFTVKWVTGLRALSLLSKLFGKAYEDDEYLQEHIFNLSKSCLKLYEHQTILWESMKTFMARLDAEDELSDIVSEYEKYVEEMHKIYLLCIKFSITGNKDLILHISEKLSKLCSDEKPILAAFDEPAAQIYIRKHLMPHSL